MSRCYPYRMKHKTSSEVLPPGYEKKANVELGLSPKKDKHKRKDKKKKRRQESESNGDVLRDLDDGSKKAQQTGVFKDFSLANGSLPETKAASSEVVHEKVAQRLQAYSSHAEMPSAGVLPISCNGLPTISKQGSWLSLESVKAACNSNGAEVAPSSSTSSKSEVILRRENHTQYLPHMETVWSTIDDQEWLFHHNNLLQSVPMIKLDENPSPLVWAEAVLLPSVGIYALPYVVPD